MAENERLGMVGRGRAGRARRYGGAAVLGALAFLCTACSDTTATLPPTPHNTAVSIWALGDSQASPNTDPARGLSWAERLGSDVGNGAIGMTGAGWVRPGTTSARTIPQQAAAVAQINSVTEFIVMAGINDLTIGLTVSQMLAGVDTLEDFAEDHGVDVLYVGIVPFPAANAVSAHNAKRLAFNAALASEFGDDYVDCSAELDTASGWLDPAFAMSPSNFHLNSAGEQVLADCINAVR